MRQTAFSRAILLCHIVLISSLCRVCKSRLNIVRRFGVGLTGSGDARPAQASQVADLHYETGDSRLVEQFDRVAFPNHTFCENGAVNSREALMGLRNFF